MTSYDAASLVRRELMTRFASKQLNRLAIVQKHLSQTAEEIVFYNGNMHIGGGRLYNKKGIVYYIRYSAVAPPHIASFYILENEYAYDAILDHFRKHPHAPAICYINSDTSTIANRIEIINTVHNCRLPNRIYLLTHPLPLEVEQKWLDSLHYEWIFIFTIALIGSFRGSDEEYRPITGMNCYSARDTSEKRLEFCARTYKGSIVKKEIHEITTTTAFRAFLQIFCDSLGLPGTDRSISYFITASVLTDPTPSTDPLLHQ